METLYRKVDDKFEEVETWDTFSSLPIGAHMVIVKPGCKSYSYDVVPAFAPFVAVAKLMADQIATKFVETKSPIANSENMTPEQEQAWHALINAYGGKVRFKSAFEQSVDFVGILEELVQDFLKAHPMLEQSHNRFLALAELIHLGNKDESY